MMYFWVIPVFLAFVVFLFWLSKRGTKRPIEGKSRLDEARNR